MRSDGRHAFFRGDRSGPHSPTRGSSFARSIRVREKKGAGYDERPGPVSIFTSDEKGSPRLAYLWTISSFRE